MTTLLARLEEHGFQISDDAMTSDDFPQPGTWRVDRDAGLVNLRGLFLRAGDTPNASNLKALNVKMNFDALEEGKMTEAMEDWAVSTQVIYVKALLAAAKVAKCNLNEIKGISTIGIWAKASPGFANIGILKNIMLALHSKIFPVAPLPAISAVGVVCLPADTALMLDADIQFSAFQG